MNDKLKCKLALTLSYISGILAGYGSFYINIPTLLLAVLLMVIGLVMIDHVFLEKDSD
jgi:hypothetical protein